MKYAWRTVLAIVAGMALAFALVVAVELFSSVVHPFPADFNGNISEHVRRYPHWILGVVVLAWVTTITAATWVHPESVVDWLASLWRCYWRGRSSST